MISNYAIIVAMTAAALAAEAEQEALLQHSGPVTDIRFRNNHPVSCSHAGAILHRRKETIRMANPAHRVTSIAVSQDEGYFHWYYAGGIPGESGNVSGLKKSDGEWTANLKVADDLIYSIEAHQGLFMALADGRVLHWKAADLEPRIVHQHTAPARSVRVSPNRNFVASGGLDRLIFVSNCGEPIGEDKITLQDHTAAIDCLAFSPDSLRLASGARDGKVRIHGAKDGKLIRTYHHLEGEVSAITWNDSRLLAGTSRGKIYELDPASASSTLVADWGDETPITALAINKKDQILAGTLNRIGRVKLLQ